ncbi:hypothetical protein [Streptomyces sp. NPDC054838]
MADAIGAEVSALLDSLIRMCPPGRRAGEAVDWAVLEESLGFGLPADYKELSEVYPPGLFGEFLTVISPISPLPTLDLRSQIETTQLTLRVLERHGNELPGDRNLMVPVCGTDNGNWVFWLRDPLEEPDRWPLVVSEARGPEWDRFDGGIVAFLVGVLSGTTKIEVFPESFPWSRPKFRAG